MSAPEETDPSIDSAIMWRSLGRPQTEPHPPWRPLRLAPAAEPSPEVDWQPLTRLLTSSTLEGHEMRGL